jgi:hypothetical protein
MRRLLSSIAVLIAVVACAPGPTFAPASPSRSSGPTAIATQTPSPTPQAQVSAAPAATRGPVATPQPVATPAPTLSPTERALVAEFREDAVVNCIPRRTELPPRAIAGVECRPDSDLVARVGLYRFRSDEDAALTYLERMASYGVEPDSGYCHQGEPADEGSPLEGVPTVVFGGSRLSIYRTGCFHDENGTANYRLTCWGGAVYVGVLGRTSDIAALADWVWRGQVDTPSPPGICVRAG